VNDWESLASDGRPATTRDTWDSEWEASSQVLVLKNPQIGSAQARAAHRGGWLGERDAGTGAMADVSMYVALLGVQSVTVVHVLRHPWMLYAQEFETHCGEGDAGLRAWAHALCLQQAALPAGATFAIVRFEDFVFHPRQISRQIASVHRPGSGLQWERQEGRQGRQGQHGRRLEFRSNFNQSEDMYTLKEHTPNQYLVVPKPEEPRAGALGQKHHAFIRRVFGYDLNDPRRGDEGKPSCLFSSREGDGIPQDVMERLMEIAGGHDFNQSRW